MSNKERAAAAQRVLGFVRAYRLAGGPERVNGVGYRVELDHDMRWFELLAADLETLASPAVEVPAHGTISNFGPWPDYSRCTLWVPDVSGISVRRVCGLELNEQGKCPRPEGDHSE